MCQYVNCQMCQECNRHLSGVQEGPAAPTALAKLGATGWAWPILTRGLSRIRGLLGVSQSEPSADTLQQPGGSA